MSSSSSSVSSVSSHLMLLAQHWNQQLVSREKQRAHEESREAITQDPITSLPLEQPLMDPCGHTFNRETVSKFKKLGPNTVECPISRRAIRIDQFAYNFYAENVLNYFTEEAHRATSATAMSSTSAGSTTSTSTATQGPVTLESLMEQMCLSREENRKTQGMILDMRTDMGIMHRQINNLVGMDYCDRIVSLVKCNHFKTVRDRGLTEEEKRRVNT